MKKKKKNIEKTWIYNTYLIVKGYFSNIVFDK